jgi:DNA replication protein DnaC
VSQAKLRELGTVGFWHDKKNLIIVGPTGCGKTQLAIAVGRAACQHKLSVMFFSINRLFEEVSANRASGTLLAWLKKLLKYDVLILDDCRVSRGDFTPSSSQNRT